MTTRGCDVTDHDWLATRFEEHRAHLRAAAHRMLGSRSEADDAVQEAWLRLSRADAGAIANLRGWLTTVVARVCLDMLRSRRARREEPDEPEPDTTGDDAPDPESATLLADTLGVALLVVLETLSPAERVAFVLHDLFAMPFEEIAGIVGRSPAATRQLASRARRRVVGAAPAPDPGRGRQREIVDAFRAAARGANLDALLALLDPEVVMRADAAAAQGGVAPETRGGVAVARFWSGRAQAARRAIVDGAAGLCWAPDGPPKVVLRFTLAGERITTIELVGDPGRMRQIDLLLLDD
jgi:RNA polymerase sigma-70 factor (ECF subfamily)